MMMRYDREKIFGAADYEYLTSLILQHFNLPAVACCTKMIKLLDLDR
jgi:hypothetical protein